jgi:hypothetical protein
MLGGNWRRAERGYRFVVADFERNPVPSADRLAARLGDLGHALMCQGRVREANEFYQRSASLLETFGSQIIQAELDFNFAAVARLRGQYHEAKELFAKGCEAFALLGVVRDSRIDQYLKIASSKIGADVSTVTATDLSDACNCLVPRHVLSEK